MAGHLPFQIELLFPQKTSVTCDREYLLTFSSISDACHAQWETIDDTKTVVSDCTLMHSINESTSSFTLPNVEACEDLACEYKANVINW